MCEKCREMKLDVNIKLYGTAMLTDTMKVFLQEANLYAMKKNYTQNIKNIKSLRFMAKNQIKYILLARKSSLEPLGLPSG